MVLIVGGLVWVLQCHCYVCDTVAPCSEWGDGNCGSDHCHAVDESHWRIARKLKKTRPVAASRAIALPAVAVPVPSPTTPSETSCSLIEFCLWIP